MPTKNRAVIITTKHRGVFFGYPTPKDYSLKKHGNTVKLKSARCAIHWGTSHGFLQLASTGPTSSSKIGAPADIELIDITSVTEVSAAAEKAWKEA